jgi:hypothetical protein
VQEDRHGLAQSRGHLGTEGIEAARQRPHLLQGPVKYVSSYQQKREGRDVQRVPRERYHDQQVAKRQDPR